MLDKPPQVSFVEMLEEEARRLNIVPREVAFPADHVVFEEGEFGDGLYVIDDGLVEISATMPERKCRVLSTMGKGGFFGEMAVVDEQPRSATVKTKAATRARFFSREEIWRILGQAPALLIALMREVSIRMRRTEQRCMEDVFQAERLALVGRFAQSIVHDLKNPLNTIGIGIDVVSAEETGPETRKEAGQLIRKEVMRLAGMIHEVLEFTRGTARSLNLEPTEFKGYIENAISEMRPEIERRGVRIECENEPPAVTVLLDPVRLLHVLNNLVNNALDVMPEGGKIMFRFRLSDGEIVTEVEDSGPGIAPAIGARLFEPFVTHGKTHGTGLGLSICKRIIEDHGGKISLVSQPGRGALFSFTLRRHA